MVDFNLEALSLRELRQLQKDRAQSSSTVGPARNRRNGRRAWHFVGNDEKDGCSTAASYKRVLRNIAVSSAPALLDDCSLT